jgi:hypothetical protein
MSVKGVVLRTLFSILLIVTGLALAGCSSNPVKAADVVGSWYGGADDYLVFKADGAFNYKNAPLQKADPDIFTQRETGVGTWKIVAQNPNDVQHIEAVYGSNDFVSQIYFETSNGVLLLYIKVGSPDFNDKYWFQRSHS